MDGFAEAGAPTLWGCFETATFAFSERPPVTNRQKYNSGFHNFVPKLALTSDLMSLCITKYFYF